MVCEFAESAFWLWFPEGEPIFTVQWYCDLNLDPVEHIDHP